jgi:hypothetical protein
MFSPLDSGYAARRKIFESLAPHARPFVVISDILVCALSRSPISASAHREPFVRSSRHGESHARFPGSPPFRLELQPQLTLSPSRRPLNAEYPSPTISEVTGDRFLRSAHSGAGGVARAVTPMSPALVSRESGRVQLPGDRRDPIPRRGLSLLQFKPFL